MNTTVARLRSELADAEFDLAQTVTRAFAKGFVTQVALRPGMYAVPFSFRPVMVFVNTDDADRALGAAFQQNSLQRVGPGDEAEVAFERTLSTAKFGTCARNYRTRRRPFELPPTPWLCGSSRHLHWALAPPFRAAENSPPHAQPAKLRLFEGH